MKTIKLTGMDEITALLDDVKVNEEINRYRSTFIYRGLPSEEYRLVPSIVRNCGEAWLTLEGPIFRNFYKYAVQENPFLSKNQWDQMIIGQHYGLPTRLLDWSCSMLMGLHFATLERDLHQMNKHDCILWKVDISELNKLLPTAYREVLDREKAYVFTVEMLQELCTNLAGYDNDMQGKALVTLEPPSIDSRIVNQYSYFTVTPAGMEDVESFLCDNLSDNSVKYIIDSSLRWPIREILDRNNINERIISPGLEGITQSIKRHYFYIPKK